MIEVNICMRPRGRGIDAEALDQRRVAAAAAGQVGGAAAAFASNSLKMKGKLVATGPSPILAAFVWVFAKPAAARVLSGARSTAIRNQAVCCGKLQQQAGGFPRVRRGGSYGRRGRDRAPGGVRATLPASSLCVTRRLATHMD